MQGVRYVEGQMKKTEKYLIAKLEGGQVIGGIYRRVLSASGTKL
jgi:hypothetical protein